MSLSGNAAGIKNLEPVARPFGIAGKGIRRAENGTTVRAHFIEKERLVEAHLIGGSAWRRLEIIGRDK